MPCCSGVVAVLALLLAQAEPSPRVPTVVDPHRGLELWGGAKVAMTAAQVQALFPRAAAPGRQTLLTDGEAELLELPGVTIAGRPAAAQFYFREGALVAVKLAVTGLPPDAPGRGLAAAAAAADVLHRRYGSGYDCGDRSFGDISAYECKWLRDAVSIRYWYMDIAGQAPLMYVAFRQADDPGYDL